MTTIAASTSRDLEIKAALRRDDALYVERLLRRSNLGPDFKFGDGDRPIHVAADCGSLKVLNLFRKLGMNKDEAGHDSLHPMQRAAKRGQTRAISVLHAMGFKLDAGMEKKQFTPLMHALSHKHLDCARLLTTLGADQKARSEGYSAHSIAVLNRCEGCVPAETKDPFAEEFIFRKVVGHSNGLGLSCELEGESMKLSGAFSPYMHERIVESLTSFFDGHLSGFSREHKRILLEAFTASSTTRNARMLLEEIEAGKPVVLNAGWYRHAINIVIVDSYLFICNGGEGIPLRENTIAAFKIDRTRINTKKLNRILWFIKAKNTREEGMTFFYEVVPKMFSPEGELVKDDLCRIVEGISPKRIKVGICSLACGKIALRVLGTMLKVRRAHPRNHRGMARIVCREAKQWSLYSRMYYLDRYMEKHRMVTRDKVTSAKEGSSELVLESWKKIQAYFRKNYRIIAYRHLALEKKLKKILG